MSVSGLYYNLAVTLTWPDSKIGLILDVDDGPEGGHTLVIFRRWCQGPTAAEFR